MMIKFTAPIDAVPFKRPRFNRRTGITFNDKRYSAYKDALGWFARQAMHGLPPLSGAVKEFQDLLAALGERFTQFVDKRNEE